MQEDNQIYFMSIQDIEIGDILKVWYAPTYALKMGTQLLESSPHLIVNNILQQLSIEHAALKIEPEESYSPDSVFYNTNNSTDVSLPSIQSIIKSHTSFQHQKTDYSTPDLQMDAATVSTENCVPTPVTYTDSKISLSSTISMGSDLIDVHLLDSDLNIFEDTPYESSAQTTTNNLQPAGQRTPIRKLPTSTTPPPLQPTSTSPLSSSASSTSSTLKKSLSSLSQKEISNKKKIYHCEICDKKYATMTNIYKHMRSHNLYLCSLCMKTFSHEHEIKEHKCPQGTVKRPQCLVCFKYLSNSWSLTRHMKIHINEKDW